MIEGRSCCKKQKNIKRHQEQVGYKILVNPMKRNGKEFKWTAEEEEKKLKILVYRSFFTRESRVVDNSLGLRRDESQCAVYPIHSHSWMGKREKWPMLLYRLFTMETGCVVAPEKLLMLSLWIFTPPQEPIEFKTKTSSDRWCPNFTQFGWDDDGAKRERTSARKRLSVLMTSTRRDFDGSFVIHSFKSFPRHLLPSFCHFFFFVFSSPMCLTLSSTLLRINDTHLNILTWFDRQFISFCSLIFITIYPSQRESSEWRPTNRKKSREKFLIVFLMKSQKTTFKKLKYEKVLPFPGLNSQTVKHILVTVVSAGWVGCWPESKTSLVIWTFTSVNKSQCQMRV